MAKLVNAYVIYNAFNASYVNDGTLITINCERLADFTPKQVWLQRFMPSGDGTITEYQVTFGVNSSDLLQYGTNLIQGVYVEQDGKGFIVDVADVNTITNACNACCDSSPVATLTRFYTGGIPLFADPATALFCITRLDDGSISAHQNAAFAYTGQYNGTFKLRSNLSGVSKYTVQSYVGWPPVAQGADTVVAGQCP